MLKTIVTPQQNNINLAIPNNYIGREIEVLVYAKDELEEQKLRPKKTMADFCGVLLDNDYQSLKLHTQQSREEWNKVI